MINTKQTYNFNSDLMMEWIKTISEFGPRRAGSPANHQAEDFIVQLLKGFGVPSVRKEPIQVEYWNVQKSIFEINDGAGFSPIEAQWIPYCAFTPEKGIEGELVYADPKKLFQSKNWKGKVVLTDISFPELDVKLLSKFSLGQYDPNNNMHDIKHPATWVRINWHFYREAVRKQAVGFIGILKDQPGGSYRMYAPYGFKEKDILDKPLTGFWVSRKDGPKLRELAKRGGSIARMVLTGDRTPAVTHNIVGEIPGESDEIVIIHSHHDSPFKSPVEDASGCSVILALAKYFAEMKNARRKILVLLTAGHFYGSIGTKRFILNHSEDILPNVSLEISVEHVAKEAVEDQNGELIYSGEPEGTGAFIPFNSRMRDLVLSVIEQNSIDRVFLLPPEGPLGDYPPTDGGDWYEAGFPLINFISNPVYLLNAEDNLDWVMKDRLPKIAAAVADIVVGADKFKKDEIREVEFRGLKRKMKLIKHLVRMKTSRFGTRPVY